VDRPLRSLTAGRDEGGCPTIVSPWAEDSAGRGAKAPRHADRPAPHRRGREPLAARR